MWKLKGVNYLVRSYSDEQGVCSYFKIVERGPNYKLFYINQAFGLTFLALDDSYGRIGDGSIFSSLSIYILVNKIHSIVGNYF